MGKDLIWGDDKYKGFKMDDSHKYFTPDIENIHVGYECEMATEHVLGKGCNWSPYKITDVTYAINHYRLRVPYLTAEQIMAEGWVEDYPSPNGYLYSFTKVVGGNGKYNEWGYYEGTRYFLKYYKNDKWLAPLEISQLIPENPDERGSREYRSGPLKFDCKDINTFRYICKILNIK